MIHQFDTRSLQAIDVKGSHRTLWTWRYTTFKSAPLINQHRWYGLHGIARRPWQDLVASHDLTKWDGCQQSCQYYHQREDYLNPYPTYGTSSIPNRGTSPVSHGENAKVLNYLRSYTVHSSKQIRVVLELLSYLRQNHLLLTKEYENDSKITEHCWWTGKPSAERDNGAETLKQLRASSWKVLVIFVKRMILKPSGNCRVNARSRP